MITIKLNVGQFVRVNWSNGAGYSVYQISDGPNHHVLEFVEEYEITSSGTYEKVIE